MKKMSEKSKYGINSHSSVLIPVLEQKTLVPAYNLEQFDLYDSIQKYSKDLVEKDVFFNNNPDPDLKKHAFYIKAFVPSIISNAGLSFLNSLREKLYSYKLENPNKAKVNLYIVANKGKEFNILELKRELINGNLKNYRFTFDKPKDSQYLLLLSLNQISLLNKSNKLNTPPRIIENVFKIFTASKEFKQKAEQIRKYVYKQFDLPIQKLNMKMHAGRNINIRTEDNNINHILNLRKGLEERKNKFLNSNLNFSVIWDKKKRSYLLVEDQKQLLPHQLKIGRVHFSLNGRFSFKPNMLISFGTNKNQLSSNLFLSLVAYNIVKKRFDELKYFNINYKTPRLKKMFKLQFQELEDISKKTLSNLYNILLIKKIVDNANTKDIEQTKNLLNLSKEQLLNQEFKKLFSKLGQGYKFRGTMDVLFYNRISGEKEYHTILLGTDSKNNKIVYDFNSNNFGKAKPTATYEQALKDIFEESNLGIYGTIIFRNNFTKKIGLFNSKTQKQFKRDIISKKADKIANYALYSVVVAGALCSVGVTGGGSIPIAAQILGYGLSAKMATDAIKAGKQIYEQNQLKRKSFFVDPFDRQHMQFYFMAAMSVAIFGRTAGSILKTSARFSKTAAAISNFSNYALFGLDIYDITNSLNWAIKDKSKESFNNLLMAVYFSFIGEYAKSKLAQVSHNTYGNRYSFSKQFLKYALKSGSIKALDSYGETLTKFRKIKIEMPKNAKIEDTSDLISLIKNNKIKISINNKKVKLLPVDFYNKMLKLESYKYIPLKERSSFLEKLYLKELNGEKLDADKLNKMIKHTYVKINENKINRVGIQHQRLSYKTYIEHLTKLQKSMSEDHGSFDDYFHVIFTYDGTGVGKANSTGGNYAGDIILHANELFISKFVESLNKKSGAFVTYGLKGGDEGTGIISFNKKIIDQGIYINELDEAMLKAKNYAFDFIKQNISNKDILSHFKQKENLNIALPHFHFEFLGTPAHPANFFDIISTNKNIREKIWNTIKKTEGVCDEVLQNSDKSNLNIDSKTTKSLEKMKKLISKLNSSQQTDIDNFFRRSGAYQSEGRRNENPSIIVSTEYGKRNSRTGKAFFKFVERMKKEFFALSIFHAGFSVINKAFGDKLADNFIFHLAKSLANTLKTSKIFQQNGPDTFSIYLDEDITPQNINKIFGLAKKISRKIKFVNVRFLVATGDNLNPNEVKDIFNLSKRLFFTGYEKKIFLQKHGDNYTLSFKTRKSFSQILAQIFLFKSQKTLKQINFTSAEVDLLRKSDTYHTIFLTKMLNNFNRFKGKQEVIFDKDLNFFFKYILKYEKVNKTKIFSFSKHNLMLNKTGHYVLKKEVMKWDGKKVKTFKIGFDSLHGRNPIDILPFFTKEGWEIYHFKILPELFYKVLGTGYDIQRSSLTEKGKHFISNLDKYNFDSISEFEKKMKNDYNKAMQADEVYKRLIKDLNMFNDK